MSGKDLRRAIARTPLAPIAAFPVRLARVARHDVRVFGQSARWLFTSREHHNYTYDLTPLNMDHLAWFVSTVCNVPVGDIRGYLAEIDADDKLRTHIEQGTAGAERRGLADRKVRYGRRLGWYAIVRAMKPEHVVETGVDKGLGTCVLASALLRNAADGHPGRVTAIDINPEAGYLVHAEPWSSVIDFVVNDSIATIKAMEQPINLFLHDSDHAVGHETNEFAVVEPKLAPDGLLLTDNAAVTDVLARHADATGRKFLFFKEEPDSHWFPGEGIGIAFRG